MLTRYRRVVRRLGAGAAMAVLAVGVTPTAATALSCASHPDASPRAIAEGTEHLSVDGAFRDHYDGAVLGTIVARETQGDGARPDYGHTELDVDVTGTYGPDVGRRAVVVQDDPGGLNGYPFEVGTHYFIPYVVTESGLYSHVCDPIAEIDPADVPELVEVAEQHAWAGGTPSAPGDASHRRTAGLMRLVAAVAAVVWAARQ